MAANTERERLEQLLLGQARVMQEAYEVLADEAYRDDLLRAALRGSRRQDPVHLPGAEPERIFSLEAIRCLCIRYRLRFLEGALYKGPVPGTALFAMRELERRAGGPVTSYMVLAPSVHFRLCDSEADPLLFVPLEKDRYYLVTRWGNDLSSGRAAIFWPLRGPLHLAATVLVIALLFTASVPAAALGETASAGFSTHRLMLLGWSALVLGGFTFFGWFAFFGQFSSQAWNSRYFNG